MRPDFLIKIANEKPPKRKRKDQNPKAPLPKKPEISPYLSNGLTVEQNDELTQRMRRKYLAWGQEHAGETGWIE